MEEPTTYFNELTYHNQLMIRKAMTGNNQMALMEELIKMGLLTQESIILIKTLYKSFQPTEEQKQYLTRIINQYILRDTTKKTIVEMLANSAFSEPTKQYQQNVSE